MLAGLPTAGRLLLGFMFTMGGQFWLRREDAGGYLSETIATMLDRNGTVPFYVPFLESVVLTHAGLFAFLVGWGELLSGLSLLLGAGSRLGAAGAAFLLLNYGLMGGYGSLAIHGIFIAILAATVYWESGRTFGADRWLHRRWPRIVIW